MNIRMVSFVLLLAMGLPVATALAAQDGSTANADAQPMQISEQQLRNFAAVRVELNRIRTQFMANLKQADTQADRQRVFRKGGNAMRQALQRHGMTPQQFRQMAIAIRDNPELREKLEAMEPGNL
ncbi:MAG TPA: DUF4168 domain-containing protein [Gammaproteobacteria bacterium]|nr:DUF4168 domain-containing protein [Gammaproteobacteria bacterium]